LTTEEVKDLQLAINGTAVKQPFFMADISNYDIILVERWCLEHQTVIDYADESLYDQDNVINYQLVISYRLLIRILTNQPTVDKTIISSTKC